MKFLLKSIYKWPGIGQDAEKFHQKCGICMKSGDALQNTKNKIIQSTRPNEIWEVDLIGRIPGSSGSNRFIFMAIDHYTKWLETVIIEHKTSENVVEAVKTLIIKKHGSPRKIFSDQGLEFDNNSIRQLSNEYGIEWIFSSPRHHETMGAVERVNQTFMNILKRLTNFGRKRWDTELEKATFAYNISPHRALNTSPYILKYGKIPKIQDQQETSSIEEIPPLSERIKNRDMHFKDYATKAIENGKKTVEYNLQYGDPVLVYRKPLSDKFKENWIQGFMIKEKVHPEAYLVTDGNKEYRFNKAHVKLDTSRTLP